MKIQTIFKKFILLIVFNFVLLYGAQNHVVPPPAEMIMMDFSDDAQLVDDLEVIDLSVGILIDQFEEKPLIDYKQEGSSVKIALLAPKKIIGSYADSVSNSITSYLIYKNVDFIFEVFDSVNEDENAILEKLSEIKRKGYDFVIAPYTRVGAQIIAQNSFDMFIFIPTINRHEIGMIGSNIVFGGMDYRRQIDILLQMTNDKISLFGDGSSVSDNLSFYIKELAFDKVVYSKNIKNIRSDLSFLKREKEIQKSSIFLNMPIVKSSLLASQFVQYKVEPYIILSTQFNYNPLLFKLTQYKDREFLYVANSIDFQNEKLKDINMILGNNPDFNWIDYSTAIGLDYIYSTILGMGSREFNEEIYDNQIEYKVRLERAGRSSFMPIENGKFRY